MKKLMMFGCAVAGVTLMGAGLVMAQAPGASRGGQLVAPQLPRAPALAETPVLVIKADQVKGRSSPILYGLMTENINFCYDGGLYAEQIRNRNFKEVPGGRGGAAQRDGLAFWSLVQTDGGIGSMEVDTNQPMNEALTRSLKLTVDSIAAGQHVGVANEGYWGMAVRPNTQYKASVWAKGGAGFAGPLTLALVSSDGKTVFAQARIDKINDKYEKHEATLTTAASVPTTKDACFQILAGSKGTVWFSMVSLFPPTYKNHGLRQDIMQMMADMNVKYMRFPGGNYIEGSDYASRFNWKATVGPIEERPGHQNAAWGYWSSDGLGLLEFLEWCEDIGMDPGMGVYAGFSLGGRNTFAAGEALKPYVQDALDEIDYAMGDAGTKWGAQRIKDGHPAPFKINYVEIGNEENRGVSYEKRYVQFRDAIKAKCPNIKVIPRQWRRPQRSVKIRRPTSRTTIITCLRRECWGCGISMTATTARPVRRCSWASGRRE